MLKTITRAVLAAALLATPAMAGGAVDYGRNEHRHSPSHRSNRSGAWIGNNTGHPGAHGRHWNSHDHFSPRGQGGHHWGW